MAAQWRAFGEKVYCSERIHLIARQQQIASSCLQLPAEALLATTEEGTAPCTGRQILLATTEESAAPRTGRQILLATTEEGTAPCTGRKILLATTEEGADNILEAKDLTVYDRLVLNR